MRRMRSAPRADQFAGIHSSNMARPGRDCRTACPGPPCYRSARVERTEPSPWEDPSLVRLWGPRFNVFVVTDTARRRLDPHP
jgi:hypothetical protein